MISEDARTQMLYDAQKKSTFLAYLFWFFLGAVSAHRMYVRRWFSWFVQLALVVCGWTLVFAAFIPETEALSVFGILALALWGL